MLSKCLIALALSAIGATAQEMMNDKFLVGGESEADIPVSEIPEVPSFFDKINDLRRRKEEGKLPKESDAFLTMHEHATKYGFAYEEHQVVTKDGYILTLARIPGLLAHSDDESQETKKPPILLQHGLGVNMMQWVFNTNDTAQAWVLARRGYDVWMGNNRGTLFSLGHVSLDHKKDRKYWDWSWEEMGTHDLPASIDYILQTSGASHLSYMGHSEGVTQLLAGGSLMPEYFNAKVNLAVLLAPPATMYYNPSKENRFLSQPKIMNLIDKAAKDLFVLDFLPYDWALSETVVSFCRLLDGKLCDLIFAASQGYDALDVDNLDRYDVYLSYLPTDSGVFNLEHYGQQYRSHDGKPHFARYDHGE